MAFCPSALEWSKKDWYLSLHGKNSQGLGKMGPAVIFSKKKKKRSEVYIPMCFDLIYLNVWRAFCLKIKAHHSRTGWVELRNMLSVPI